MPTIIQFRKGTDTQNDNFTGSEGEISVDTTNQTIRVHDGSTAGGVRLAKYTDISNLHANADNITTGTVNTTILGSGTANSTTYLAGDNTWQSISAIAGSNTQVMYNDSDALAGSAGFTFDNSSNNVTVGNTVSAIHFDSVSDIQYKENIQSLSTVGGIINSLNPVQFNWKNGGEKSYGLIAQEVEAILPDIVHTKSDSTKTISYTQLIPFLIQVIKDQQKQIDDINDRIA